MENKIPRDKNRKPLSLEQMVMVNFLGPPRLTRLGRILSVGREKSTVELEGGAIVQLENSKIEAISG